MTPEEFERLKAAIRTRFAGPRLTPGYHYYHPYNVARRKLGITVFGSGGKAEPWICTIASRDSEYMDRTDQPAYEYLADLAARGVPEAQAFVSVLVEKRLGI